MIVPTGFGELLAGAVTAVVGVLDELVVDVVTNGAGVRIGGGVTSADETPDPLVVTPGAVACGDVPNWFVDAPPVPKIDGGVTISGNVLVAGCWLPDDVLGELPLDAGGLIGGRALTTIWPNCSGQVRRPSVSSGS